LTASEALFRYRIAVHAAIYFVGFTAPWNYWDDFDGRQKAWLALAGWLTRSGWLSFDAATILVLVAATLCAAAAAGLRVWGVAYLGSCLMKAPEMRGGGIVAGGPYRYLRNPLYAGTWLHTLALAVLMPPSGAIVALVATTAMEFILIRGEERFLTAQLGEPYLKYQAEVPRLFPSIHGPAPAMLNSCSVQPRWRQAVLAEIYVLGVAASFAVLGWRYNARLLTQGVLVWFGVSLVARAFAMEKGAK
jgi:protein-S-isoprenylcysteine O-methyltransferase Ste14